MSEVPVVELVDVYKVYHMPAGDVHALNGVTFSVMEGEFVAIMGPSGSGKSTLMNMIGCLDVPTMGEMYIDGRSVKEMTDDELTIHRRDRIGFIFQKFNLIGLLTAYENVEYPMILKYGKRDDTGRPKELLASVGIDEAKMTHTPFELSGGQQQRVAIARALANDPALLLCDEPTGNLDSKMSEQIMALLQDLNRKGRTIVMVTHDPHTATYANRTIVIRDGEIVNE
ncbi:ABC transporter ATP-binding protein [Methanocorpusculum vombati]|uniref:ABC transporter ATP-binding protein n=1 Tax=Methanocorpusculum vombati TaxID=3002864 RepID=A0ABT4IN13_9EURY|nr:ABC transporter ATP-binding protein [Methanocorpusculum vombati]MCZ9320337.1 ABC transporter ATP-binding protein [Methanocorpusculum sp.]MCZ0862714.1 ABC transporter ATP-binding protein [Methanocorpusculum vombati]MDE2520004.1 ABC transporter ATP-binding protein [Methanocorpusculum sp.]MDE2535205.1 ABC transporter ATP-binding protein [Methanocorpusculum sp.]MDE2545884.1 ABC transporter ATP-binding protein [Methanocorpusculum sp.]